MLSTLTSAIRHILGMILGTYIAQGLVSADQVEILTNAVAAIVGVAGLVAWSLIEKKLKKD